MKWHCPSCMLVYRRFIWRKWPFDVTLKSLSLSWGLKQQSVKAFLLLLHLLCFQEEILWIWNGNVVGVPCLETVDQDIAIWAVRKVFVLTFTSDLLRCLCWWISGSVRWLCAGRVCLKGVRTVSSCPRLVKLVKRLGKAWISFKGQKGSSLMV